MNGSKLSADEKGTLLDELGGDERKLRLLEWLLTIPPSDRKPLTQGELAGELGVSPRTLRYWQSQEPFVKVWRREAQRLAGPPERAQMVLEALFRKATSDDRNAVAAARLWGEWTGHLDTGAEKKGRVAPKGTHATDVRELSDDALFELAAQRIAAKEGL